MSSPKFFGMNQPAFEMTGDMDPDTGFLTETGGIQFKARVIKSQQRIMGPDRSEIQTNYKLYTEYTNLTPGSKVSIDGGVTSYDVLSVEIVQDMAARTLYHIVTI
ncbi:MAG: hypothetical protein WC440_02195 [Candidatus Omnitrophota bacterium]